MPVLNEVGGSISDMWTAGCGSDGYAEPQNDYVV